MWNKCVLFIQIVIYNVAFVESQDPCNSYIAVNDYKRSAGYERTGSASSISICDNLLTTGWYRSISPSGPVMPNVCPNLYRCGSDGSIWLNLADSDMPTTNNTKAAVACLADLFDCCSKSYNIEVKNCNDDYFVYKLVSTTACPEAYCFGTEAPCPTNQYSENGYTPGCGAYPQHNITGTVTPALRQEFYSTRAGVLEIDEITFECKFTPPPDPADFSYDVYWYINDKDIPIKSFTKVDFADLNTTLLLEEHWKNTHKMNMVVSCSTRIRFDAIRSPSPHYWSHEFEAGLKPEKREYFVEETKSITIPFHLTVPLGCRKETLNGVYEYQYHKCTLNILTLIPTYQNDPNKHCGGTQITENGLAFNNQNCGIHFNAKDWTAASYLNVTGDVDSLYNSNNRIANIRLVTQHSFLDLWENLIIPEIKVNIIDSERQTSDKQCHSVNDPHITPFNPGYYNHYIPGEYVMYKHAVFPIQINAYFRRCNGFATCNCGVAVKNADGLFVINMCPSDVSADAGWYGATKMNRYIEKQFCDDTHMTLSISGETYTIDLPTGTRIRINVGEAFINSFIIKASVLDIGQLTGLCGPYDGGSFRYILSNYSVTTDSDAFKRHYYVPEERSLFKIDWTADNSDSLISLQQYCVCKVNATHIFPVDSPYILCDLTYPVQKCTALKGSRETFSTRCSSARQRRSTWKREATFHGRYRRDVEIEDGSIEKYAIAPYNISEYVEQEIVWRNGWTEMTAYAHCEEGFNQTAAYAKCTELVPGINVSSFIQSCMTDIKIGGDDSWLEYSLNAYKSACTVEAVMIEQLREQNTSSSGNKTFLDELLEASCVNDCSGQGTCIQGECQCDTGYIQDDCSKEANSVPDIAMNSVSGHCDTKHRACNKLVIPGYGFNPDGIKCGIRKIQVTENGSTVDTNKTITDGEYLNQFSCQCSLPSRKKRSSPSAEIIATGYMISVANGDGSGTYSDEITFLIYNSDCFECNISSVTCIEKSDCPTTPSPIQSTSLMQETSTISSTSESTSQSQDYSTSTSAQSPSASSSAISAGSTGISTSTTTTTSTSTQQASDYTTLTSAQSSPVSSSSNSVGSSGTSKAYTTITSSTSTQQGTDPCTSYTNMTGDVTRSVAWTIQPGDPVKCDATITERWYRIVSDAGNDMVTTCPPTDRCGTYNPIWLNGTLSSYADGIVERDVCVSDIFDCCSDTWKIKLRNCGSFMLYYLPQSASCPQAYCFGTLYITTTSTKTPTTAPPTTSTTTSTTTPHSSSTLQLTTNQHEDSDTPEENSKGETLSLGSIVGAVIGVTMGIAVAGLATKLLIHQKSKASRKSRVVDSTIDLQKENTSGSFNNIRPSSAASAKSIDVMFSTQNVSAPCSTALNNRS